MILVVGGSDESIESLVLASVTLLRCKQTSCVQRGCSLDKGSEASECYVLLAEHQQQLQYSACVYTGCIDQPCLPLSKKTSIMGFESQKQLPYWTAQKQQSGTFLCTKAAVEVVL